MVLKVRMCLTLLFMGVFVFHAQVASAQSVGFQAPATPLDKATLEKERILSDIGLCAGKKVYIERLHCYDKFAVDQGLIEADEFDKIIRDVGKFGFWTFKIQELTTNNEQTASLSLGANQAIDGGNGFTMSPTLSVRCSYGKSEVILDWKKLLTNTRRPARASKFPFFIEYRFDNNPKVNSDWELSFDRRGVFAPDPIGFVKEALRSESLVVNLTPADGGLTTVSFTLKGLKEGTEQLSKACYKGVKHDEAPQAVTPKVENLIYR